MAPRFHARLHGLLAAKARIGVILRRGPSRAVCSILWDRDRDTFQLGQWLRGRIYERRADLSPDGRFLIYFAMDGRWDSSTRGSWTAISRTPWLKAVVLLSKGDCWHGGGLFTGKRTYWLNDGRGHALMTPSSLVERDVAFQPEPYYGGECPGVYYVRLQRDGWTYVRTDDFDSRATWSVFERRLPKGWILRKYAHAELDHPKGKGCYWDEHELEHPKSKTTISYPDWEWVEQDKGTLVYAQEGKLYRAPIGGVRGIETPRLLKDFNDMEFQAIRAPY